MHYGLFLQFVLQSVHAADWFISKENIHNLSTLWCSGKNWKPIVLQIQRLQTSFNILLCFTGSLGIIVPQHKEDHRFSSPDVMKLQFCSVSFWNWMNNSIHFPESKSYGMKLGHITMFLINVNPLQTSNLYSFFLLAFLSVLKCNSPRRNKWFLQTYLRSSAWIISFHKLAPLPKLGISRWFASE